jgi:hypothetical protein
VIRVVSDESQGREREAWTYFMKHSIHNVTFWKESTGVEVWPEPYEDLLTHIYI